MSLRNIGEKKDILNSQNQEILIAIKVLNIAKF